MTKDVSQQRHTNAAPVADDLTVRLGERIGNLCRWSVDQGLEFQAEPAYETLGINESTGFDGMSVAEI